METDLESRHAGVVGAREGERQPPGQQGPLGSHSPELRGAALLSTVLAPERAQGTGTSLELE